MTTIEIPVGASTVEAFVGRPDEPGEFPGVLFFIDAFGLRPQIQRMVDRIASWGYVVLAPNVFYREGTVADLAPTQDLFTQEGREAFFAGAGPRIARLTPDLVAADSAAYVVALRALDGVGPGPLGVTGYCMGARLAVRAGCGLPEEFGAVGAFHGGGLVTEAEDSPHWGLEQARAAFVFGHADNDRSMGPEAVTALGEALTAAGLEHSNAIYPGSPHGYTMNDTAMYDETGAERHYRELRELLDARL